MLFCSNNNGTDDFLYNVLSNHRIVEMLYHSINNGGCGFLLLWFPFFRKYFWSKTRSSCCNIHETGSCHFDMTHFFRPVLTYINNKSTKWRFLSSLFINRSFNTFRSIQCEQFKEKLSEIRDWDQADRHFAAHYRFLFLN